MSTLALRSQDLLNGGGDDRHQLFQSCCDGSSDEVPSHNVDRVEKLSPTEIVDIEIGLLPIDLGFHPGEQLRFVISSRNPLGTPMPAIREYGSVNSGQHVIHTDGEHSSCLLLPIKE